MTGDEFRSEVAARPLLIDGAMGTQLLLRGLPPNACGMEWNLSHPSEVAAIHADYRRAGCRLLTTNSFGGSAFALDRHGQRAQVRFWNEAAAKLARQAAGTEAWVAGDVGPFGDFLEPLGEVTAEELREVFREQVEGLLAGGVDAILIETMSDPAEVEVAISAALACRADLAVLASYTFQKTAAGEFRTLMGTTVDEAMHRALSAGAVAVGANCGTSLSLEDNLRLARQMVAAARGATVLLQPNAGSPRRVGSEVVYDATPAQMRETAIRLRECGLRLLGGCCGTTPGHLEAMAEAMRA